MIDWTIGLPEQVVVTGTASGLGHECARLLTDAGVRVIGVDVAEPGEELAKADTFTAIRGSITEAQTWENVIAAVDGSARSLGFVAAAAILDVGVLGSEDIAIWRRAWEVNVLGNIVGLTTLMPLLTQAEHASVVVDRASTPASASSNSPPTPRPRPR